MTSRKLTWIVTGTGPSRKLSPPVRAAVIG